MKDIIKFIIMIMIALGLGLAVAYPGMVETAKQETINNTISELSSTIMNHDVGLYFCLVAGINFENMDFDEETQMCVGTPSTEFACPCGFVYFGDNSGGKCVQDNSINITLCEQEIESKKAAIQENNEKKIYSLVNRMEPEDLAETKRLAALFDELSAKQGNNV